VPWPVRRGDKSDFNDTLKEGGPEAVAARIEEARSNSFSGNSGGSGNTLQGVNGGRAGGDGQEPPEDWQNARPPLGGPPLLLPPKPGLPAFYPAPTEDRDTAKARQDAALNAHMYHALHLIDLRRELRHRRDDEVGSSTTISASIRN
jgi:hypothetical protein